MGKEFYKEKLENGLTILFEKRNTGCVAVSCAVKEGSAYESLAKKGIAHFTEHLMFKGTETRSHKEIASSIEKKGGVLNAYTAEELTCYWNKLPSKYFSSGIGIAKDLILNPRMDEQEFLKEKNVILEEIKMYHDNPHLHVLNKIKELLYKKPFGLSGTGTEESVKSLKIKDLRNFFLTRYATNKMILCVVGNISLEEIEDYAKNFPEKKAKNSRVKIEKINNQIVEKRKGLVQASLALGFHINPGSSSKRYANEIFNVLLGVGMASRLFEQVREKRGLAYDIRSMIEQGKNYGYQIIYAGTTKEKIKECKEIILEEIRKIKTLEKKELNDAKEQLIGLRKVESEESINVMNALINEELAGKAENFYDYEKNLSGVKLKDVRNTARIKSCSSIMLVPG